MRWFTCDICNAHKYCSEEEFRNHREDCIYKHGRTQKPVPVDESAFVICPKCKSGNIRRVGVTSYCSDCGTVVGGGNAYIQ